MKNSIPSNKKSKSKKSSQMIDEDDYNSQCVEQYSQSVEFPFEESMLQKIDFREQAIRQFMVKRIQKEREVMKDYQQNTILQFFLLDLIQEMAKHNSPKEISIIENQLKQHDRIDTHGLNAIIQQQKENDEVDLQIYDPLIVQSIFQHLMPVNCYKLKAKLARISQMAINMGVFILGMNGAGKTSLIIGLLDYQLKSIKNKGIPFLKLAKPLQKRHLSLETNQTGLPVTQNLETYQLKMSGSNSKQSHYLIDTPGNFQDINKKLLILSAEKNCQRSAFIIIHDLQFLKTSEGVYDLAKNIAQNFIFSTFEELKSILILILNNKGQRISKNDAVSSLRDCLINIKISSKEEAAVRFILQSIQEERNYFKADSSFFADLKKRIMILTFSKTKRMNIISQKNEKQIKYCGQLFQRHVLYYLEEKQFEKILFYLNQLIILHEMFPDIIQSNKNRVDKRLINFSTKVNERFFHLLNQKIEGKMISPQELNNLENKCKILKKFNQLAKINENIICQIDLRKKMSALQDTLKNLINGSCANNQIQNIANLIISLNSKFDCYVPNLMKKIEEKCRKGIEASHRSALSSKQTKNARQFDKSFRQYKTFYDFYSKFAEDRNTGFLQISKFPDYKQVLRGFKTQNNEIIVKLKSDIIQLINCCKNESLIPDKLINSLNQANEVLIYSCQSQQINNQKINSLFREIQTELQPISQALSTKIMTIFRFNQNFEHQIPILFNLKQNYTIICKKIQMRSISAIPNLSYDRLNDIIEQRRTQFRSKLEQLIKLTQKYAIFSQQTMKQYSILDKMEKKVFIYDMFTDEEEKKLQPLYQIFKLALDNLVQSVSYIQFSDRMNQSQIQQLNKQYESICLYHRFGDQISNKIENLAHRFEQKLKKFYQAFRRTHINIKQIRNFTELQKFSQFKNKIKYYLQNFLKYDLKDGRIIRCLSEHTDIYKSAKSICEKLIALIINVQNQKIEKNQSGQLNQNNNSFDEQEKVKIFKYIYEQVKDICEEDCLYVYLKNQSPKLFNIEGGSWNVIKKEVKEIVHLKVNELQSSVEEMSLQGENGLIFLSDSLKKQCKLWLAFWQQTNHGHLVDQKRLLESIIQDIDLKVAEYSQHLKIGINDVFNLDEGVIKNECIFKKYYLDLKASHENKIGNYSNQLKKLLSCLESCIKKQTHILNELKNSATSGLHPKLLSQIEQAIQLSKYLRSFISNEDIKKYSITSIDILQNSFNRAAEQVKRMKKNGILNIILNLISKDHNFSDAKEKIDYEQQDNQYLIGSKFDISQNLSDLKKILDQEEIKIKGVYQHPLDKNSIDNLEDVYKQASSENKISLRTKIPEHFKKLYHIFYNLPYVKACVALEQLKFAYKKIPSELRDISGDYNKYLIQAEKKKEALEQGQRKIISTSSLSDLIEKYEDYFKSNIGFLLYQCSQQIQRKTNIIEQQIQSKNRPIEMIVQVKTDILSIKLEKNISNTSDLNVIFEGVEGRILIKIQSILEKSIKNIKQILQREVTTSSFILEEIIIQTKDILDIHSKLMTGLQKGKQMVDKITQFLKQMQNKFQIYCPIDNLKELKKEQNYNLDKFGALLKVCIESGFIYKKLLISYGEKSDKEAIEEMIDESRYSNEIIEKIQSFQNELSKQKDIMITKLTKITFDELSYASYTGQEVQDLLVDCDKTIKLLCIHEAILKQMEAGCDLNQETYSSNIVSSLQQKFDKFLHNFFNKIENSVKTITSQLPKNFNFFQLLLDTINNGYGKFLVSENNDSMMKEVLKEPIQFLKKKIKIHISEFKETIKVQRQKLVNFIETEKHEYQQEMSKYEQDYTKELESIANKKRQTEEAERKKFTDANSRQLKQDAVRQIQDNYKNNQKTAEDQYKERCRLCTQKFNPSRQDKFMQNYILALLNCQKIRQGLNSQYDQLRQYCREIIAHELNEMKDKKMIIPISNGLEKYGFGGYDINIKEEHDIFKFYFNIIFDLKTKFQDAQYAAEGVKTFPSNQLPRQYKQLLKQQCKQIEKRIQQLKKMVREKGLTTKKQMIEAIVNRYSQITERVEKLASIFCVWSIQNSSNNQSEKQVQYEIKPHPVQIVASLLLTQTAVGSQEARKKMQSKLAEIGTGEGKSIVLATLACYFAIQGYQVDVACYSQYLSSRDYKSFILLFKYFGVENKIQYGTFNQLCQKIINVEELKKITEEWLVNESKSRLGNIGNKTMKWFKEFTKKAIELLSKTKKIFLCDQVDVFFQKQYFGEVFKPILRLCYSQCTRLIHYIWEKIKINRQLKAEQIISSEGFKALVIKFPILENLFKNQVQQMIEAALNPQKPKHKFIIQKDNIKYMDNGSLSQKLHYGFETIFLYLKLHDQNKITQIRKQNIFIPINVAQFLYSYIPKYYSAIIGLSGTISQITKQKQNLLSDFYDIIGAYIYLLPSIYGKQKQCLETAPYLQNKDTYYAKIIELTKIQHDQGRPVFICIENHPKLKELQNNPLFINFIDKNEIVLNFLHQYLNDEEQRDRNVKQAVRKGQITLMTKQYLRGTDFVVLDKFVKEHGGVHIILIYITESKSQFIQCKGRTSRMCEQGSIDFVYNMDQLPKEFKFPKDGDSSLMISAIQKYWNDMDKKMIEQKKVKIEKNAELHERTMKFVNGTDGESNNFLKFIHDINYFSPPQKKTIVIGIDATSSMKQVFDVLINHLKKILTRIDEMKLQRNIVEKLQIMIAVYRNYNSGAKILEKSELYSQGEHLLQFLKNIKTEKGWGNEAIQILFQYINNELKGVVELILIGDAPPNTVQHIERKRKLNPAGIDRANNDWPDFLKDNPNKYPYTNVEKEIQKFPKQLIINGLYLKNKDDQSLNLPTEVFFKNLTSQFNGSVKELNFRDRRGVGQDLMSFLTTNILTAMVGIDNKKSVEDQYNKRYG